MVSLSERIKLAVTTAEGLIASGGGDDSIVLRAIGMVSSKNSEYICPKNEAIMGQIKQIILKCRSTLIDLIPFWSQYFQLYHFGYKQASPNNEQSNSINKSLQALESMASLLSCCVRLNALEKEDMMLSFNKSPLLKFWYKSISRLPFIDANGT